MKERKWSHLVVSDSLRLHGVAYQALLCPGKSTGVGCHFLISVQALKSNQKLLIFYKEKREEMNEIFLPSYFEKDQRCRKVKRIAQLKRLYPHFEMYRNIKSPCWEIGINCVVGQLYFKNKQTHRKREQIWGYTGRRGRGELEEGGQKYKLPVVRSVKY